jgi:hypothetical protein
LTTRQTFGAIDGEQLAPMSGRDPLAAISWHCWAAFRIGP